MKAVILAGGKGTRLAPYTTVFPKPLMPIGEKPILEMVIRQLKSYGFTEIVIAVGYLSELIKAFFGDGSSYGVKIRYSNEKTPLGTAGPLALIEGLDDTFLVMNGDVLTLLPYDKLLKYHKQKKGAATVAVHKRTMKVDYGVVKTSADSSITDYIEKPELNYEVSMGIYIFEPKALAYIPKDQKLDFPDLVKKMISSNEKIYTYPSDDYWLDIGRHDDYEKAQQEFDQIKDKLFNVK